MLHNIQCHLEIIVQLLHYSSDIERVLYRCYIILCPSRVNYTSTLYWFHVESIVQVLHYIGSTQRVLNRCYIIFSAIQKYCKVLHYISSIQRILDKYCTKLVPSRGIVQVLHYLGSTHRVLHRSYIILGAPREYCTGATVYQFHPESIAQELHYICSI